MFGKPNIHGPDFWQVNLNCIFCFNKKNTPLDWEKKQSSKSSSNFDQDNYAGALCFSFNFVSSENKGDEIEYKYLNEFSYRDLSLTTNFIFEKQVQVKTQVEEQSSHFQITYYFTNL